MALRPSQASLRKWTKQKWRTKSGKPSTQGPKATGERYLPSAAIKALSPQEYAASTAAKKEQLVLVSSFPNSLKRYQLKPKDTDELSTHTKA